MVGFALITVYMLFAASESPSLPRSTLLRLAANPKSVYLAVKGVQDVEAQGDITASTVFGNKIFRNIVISLLATYGLYILSSLIALEPWHMSEFVSHRLTLALCY